jgi:translation initiation factor 2D
VSDIDNAFEQAFLYGIYHYRELNPDVSKHNIPFPLAQSWVMSDLVLPFLPAYTSKQTASLVIKKTSYKNARKFIKALEKRKLVLVKEKPGNEVDIWDIDFNDPTFTDFVPYRLPRKQSYASNGVSQLHDDGQESTADDAIGQRLRKVDLFKPNASVLPIFKSNKARCVTAPCCYMC